MARAIGLVLVALLAGFMVFRLAAPQVAPRASPAFPASSVPSAPAIPSGAPVSPQPLPAPLPPSAADTLSVPRSAEAQGRQTLEAKRAPYYDQLRTTAGSLLTEVGPASDDATTLLVYCLRDESDTSLTLLQNVVAPDAFRFGFNRIRCYLPNPPDSPERYRLYAESSLDSHGVWHTFLK